MPIEDRIEQPLPPDAPKALDLAKCQKLISASDKYLRQPAGDFIKEMADQLRLAVVEIGGTSSKIVTAQNEAIRYQRDFEQAARDLTNANVALLTARGDLRRAQEEMAALKPKEAAPTPTVAPKKRGRPGKVVPLNPAMEKKAEAK